MRFLGHGRSLLCALAIASACTIASRADALTPEERTARCERIRDVAADNGISAGYLLAGIASAETNLSHCWTELDWACQGPDSPDCDGAVVAGAGDGPCELQQGGLGMFQFDGGTFDETIARDGDGVLLLAGNVTRAIDFVVNMVMNSQYVDASTPEEAKAWMNEVTVDGPLWDAWIMTVTHYYNGCAPGACGVFDQRYQHYSDNGRDVFDEQGEAFWEVSLPPCAPIPAEGALLEETDTCFTKGGPLPYWRVGIGGESNLHIWTGTIADAAPVNFVEWSLAFDEGGDYLLEVSVPNATSTAAMYVVEHAGAVDEITVDQSASVEGYVTLGTFDFAAGDGQGVFLGDDTGEADGEKLVADALRITRIGAPGGGGTGGAGVGGMEAGGAGEGGAGDGGDDGDDGCTASSGTTGRAGGTAVILTLLLGLSWVRRRAPSSARAPSARGRR